MLDSSDRIPRGPTSSSDNARWRSWMPNRDVLNFITGGRMSSLRELSIAIDYKDWVCYSCFVANYFCVDSNVLSLLASLPPTTATGPPFAVVEYSIYR